jgi:hypothetical protein
MRLAMFALLALSAAFPLARSKQTIRKRFLSAIEKLFNALKADDTCRHARGDASPGPIIQTGTAKARPSRG